MRDILQEAVCQSTCCRDSFLRVDGKQTAEKIQSFHGHWRSPHEWLSSDSILLCTSEAQIPTDFLKVMAFVFNTWSYVSVVPIRYCNLQYTSEFTNIHLNLQMYIWIYKYTFEFTNIHLNLQIYIWISDPFFSMFCKIQCIKITDWQRSASSLFQTERKAQLQLSGRLVWRLLENGRRDKSLKWNMVIF